MFHVIYNNNYFQQHNHGDDCPMVTYNYYYWKYKATSGSYVSFVTCDLGCC